MSVSGFSVFFLALALATVADGATTARPPSSTAAAPAATTVPLPPECPPRSAVYDKTRSCLWILEQNLKWADADRTCMRHGGKLASVVDEMENAFIFELARRSNVSVPTFWLGKVTATVGGGGYEWHDGTRSRTLESIKKPSPGVEDCMTLWADNETAERSWHNWDCKYSQGYASVCKKPYRFVEPSARNESTPSPLDDYIQTRRCCTACGRRCASNERCVPDDLDCMWKQCPGESGIGWCLPL